MNHLRRFFYSIFLYTSLCVGQSIQKKINVSEGDKIHDSLSSEAIHTYQLNLPGDHFVYGQVMQESVDVTVKIYDPDNEQIAYFDGPGRGAESYTFEAKEDGDYRIEVAPFEDGKGSYTFLLLRTEPLANDPAGKVRQLLTQFTGNTVPGAAVLIMKGGETVFSEAYGMASLTYKVPFETDTRTNIGSTSKQFTAFAVLLLEESGLLSLDDDIREYFPELPDFGEPVTIRHLLTHTSGYREYLNTLAMAGHDPTSSLDRQLIIEIVQRQPELQNEPGTEWNYNNTAFALLAMLVERISEKPFPQWMKENVFEPLDMDHTSVRANQHQVVPGRSQGYSPAEDGSFEEATDLGGAMGAGGIYTNLDDLKKWVQNFLDPQVGSKAIIEKMTTPYVLKNGDTTNYGLGIFVEELNGLKYYHHGGADVAHRSMLMIFPELEGAVITQSNNANFGQSLPEKIAEFFFEEEMETEQDPSEQDETIDSSATFEYDPENFEGLTGRYELEVAPGFILAFYRHEDRIYTQATGQPEIDLKATSDSTFALQGVNASLTFHLKEDGTADTLTLHQNGDHLAKRVSWQPSKEELQQYTGRYFSAELEAFYTVEMEEDQLVLKHYRLEDIKLTPGEKDSFAAGFPIAELTFVRNEQDEVTGFLAGSGRTRGVLFEKIDQ